MSYDIIAKQFAGQQAAAEYTCWCGIRFAMPSSLFMEYKRVNEARPRSFSLYCPLGHSMMPAGPSEADRLREELERANSRAARADARVVEAQRSIAARKGQITKLKKRVAAGVCPCCTRTFQNLARHMKGQHPGYAGDES